MSDPAMFDWPDDVPVHEAVGQAIGAASMCWETPEGAGEFDSTRASAIVDELMSLLRRKLWVEADE